MWFFVLFCFFVIVCKILFSVCLRGLHIRKRNEATFKITMWKKHIGLEGLYIIQIITKSFQSSRLSKVFVYVI